MRWCKNVKRCIVSYFSATLCIAKPRQPFWDCRQCLTQTSFGLGVIWWKVTLCCLSTFSYHGFENGPTLSTAKFFTTLGNYYESSYWLFQVLQFKSAQYNMYLMYVMYIVCTVFPMQQWCHKQRGGYFKFQKHLK